jgi:hypothetical protein
MISKPILAIFRNLPSMNILRQLQLLILVKENNVDTYTKFPVNAKEKEYARGSTDSQMHPETLQNHNERRTIFDFIQCYPS